MYFHLRVDMQKVHYDYICLESRVDGKQSWSLCVA